jgi:GxxExxY protein
MESRDPLTAQVIGAAIEVHRVLGPGLLESVYEWCLSRELTARGIAHLRQVALPVVYKGEKLDADLRIDIYIPGLLVVEIKSVEALAPIHDAQLLIYLRLSNTPLGLLLNFNVVLLKDGIKRLILSSVSASSSASASSAPLR